MYTICLISQKTACLWDHHRYFMCPLALCSDRPSVWCKDNWIHWRALKSAFSVKTQLSEILMRLQQVQQLSELP